MYSACTRVISMFLDVLCTGNIISIVTISLEILDNNSYRAMSYNWTVNVTSNCASYS